jgi:NAD(P)-dependent dehydrogenase (short-subunit alcohol dehydrogenase family)
MTETDSGAGAQRVALITGGTGGLGTAVTRTFLDRGCAAVVTYRRESEAERLRADVGGAGRLLLVSADVTDTTAVEGVVREAVDAFGRLDYLVNLVGGWAGGKPVWETAGEEWDRTLALNLRSAFATCRAVIPQMIAQGYGRIVNVSSRTAVRPTPGAAAYAVSKMGVITLTETLALEVRHGGSHDITVNCVLPSVIDTPANRRATPGADPAQWVRPEQLAAVIAWLTSPEAAPISGAALPVYGRA